MIYRLSKTVLPGSIFSFIICFLPFLEGGAHPASLVIIHTLLFMVISFLGYKIFRGEITFFDLPVLSAFFLPFLFYIFLESCFSPYPFASFLSFWEVLVFFFLFLLTYHFSKNEDFAKWLLIAFALSFFLQALLVQLFSLSSGYKRTAVYFFNANHLAAYLSMGFFILAPFLMFKIGDDRKGNLLKIVIFMILLLLLSSMVLEKSRGALISFPVAFFFFIFLLRNRIRKREFISLVIVAILIIAVGSFLLYERFEGGKDIYRYERIRIWRASLSLFSEDYLFGVGPGIFEYRAVHHQFPQLQSLIRYGKHFSTPHSDYLLLLAELGLFGLILLLIPLSYVIWRLFKKDRSLDQGGILFSGWSFPLKESIVCALLVLLIQGFFDNLSERPALYMSFSMLLGILFSRMPGRRERTIKFSSLSKSAIFLMTFLVSIFYLYYFAVLSPYLADRIMQKAYSLKVQNKNERAIQWCSRAIFFNNIHPDFYNFRGEYNLLRIENEKFHPDIFLTCGEDFAQAGLLNRAKALYPLNSARLYQELFYQGISPEESFQSALNFYHEAERLATLDPFIPYECASMNFAAKNYDHTMKELKNSLDIEPYFLQAQLFLAESYRVTGEREKARKVMEGIKKKFKDLEVYRLQNDYELKILDYDRDAYMKICQDLGIDP